MLRVYLHLLLKALPICLLLTTSGCITMSARPDGGNLNESEPTVSDFQMTFLGVGAEHYDAKAACNKKSVDQVQVRYVPILFFEKVHIWCKP